MSLGWRRSLKIGVFLLLSYAIFCQFFLITHAAGGVARLLTRVMLWPAVTVDSQSVSYRSVAELTQGILAFTDETKRGPAFDQALTTSVNQAYVEQLAKELGVEVTRDELADYPLDLAELEAGLELAKWNERDYRRYMLKPLLLAQKTLLAFEASESYQAKAIERTESLRKKLDQGLPMSELAMNFSEHHSSVQAGDLGIMRAGDLPDWLKPTVDLEIGAVSERLNAPDAYWLVTVIARYPSDIPEQAAIHVRGAAVKKRNFGDVISEKAHANPAWSWVW